MTRILIIGRRGQVAWELRRALLSCGQVAAVGRPDVDLADPDTFSRVMRRFEPDIVVNAAAYNQVDTAEEAVAMAERINGEAPGVMAREAARRRALFIHYSTDYVFDGEKAVPYDENDPPAPLSAYGRSKLLGEQRVQESAADFLILRTSWIYASRGDNFLKTVLRLAHEREELRVVSDQLGAPTWARLLADYSAAIVASACKERESATFASGVFHLTAAGETSRYGFAEAILKAARGKSVEPLRVEALHPVRTCDDSRPARRPRNSRLDCAKAQSRFGLAIASWQVGVELCMEELFGW